MASCLPAQGVVEKKEKKRDTTHHQANAINMTFARTQNPLTSQSLKTNKGGIAWGTIKYLSVLS